MNKNVINRVIDGLGANTYSQIVVIIIQIAGVPILLHYWGAKLYGEWLILFAIPAYLTLSDLGFSKSASNDMAARIARDDREGALMVFQSFSALVYLLVAIGLLLTTLIVTLLPVGNWLNFSELSITEVRWLIWLLAAEVLLKLLEGIWHAGLYSNGEYPLSAFIYSSAMFIQYGSVWICAIAGYGPVEAAGAFLSIRVVTILFVRWISIRRHPWLRHGFRRAHWKHIHPLLRPSFANLAIPLAQTLNLQGMVLVIGSVIGPIGVVTFSTLRTLTGVIPSLVRMVNNAIQPELARAWGSANQTLLQQLYTRGIQAAFWLAIGATFILVLVGSPLLNIWTEGKVVMNVLLFRFLLISAFAYAAWSTGITLLQAANLHFKASLWYATISASTVLLAILLLHSTDGVAYAGFALLLMNTLMCFFVIGAANSLAKISIGRVFIEIFNIRPVLSLLRRKLNVR